MDEEGDVNETRDEVGVIENGVNPLGSNAVAGVAATCMDGDTVDAAAALADSSVVVAGTASLSPLP